MRGQTQPWLDWLRFGAALVVVAVHARGFSFVAYGELPVDQRTVLTGAWFALSRLGREAVMVFFVLSGYLVGGKVIERSLDGSFNFTAYSLDRVTRLGIPLVPAVGLSVFAMVATGMVVSPVTLVGNLLFLQGILVEPLPGDVPLWTLSYEAWFSIAVLPGCALARGSGRGCSCWCWWQWYSRS